MSDTATTSNDQAAQVVHAEARRRPPDDKISNRSNSTGAAQLDKLLQISRGAPKVDDIVALLAQFPQDRNAMFTLLQENLGNGFVQRVVKAEQFSEGLAAADGRSGHAQTSIPAPQQRRSHETTKAETEAGVKPKNRSTPTDSGSNQMSDREAEYAAGSAAQIFAGLQSRTTGWEARLPQLQAWAQQPGNEQVKSAIAQLIAELIASGERTSADLAFLHRYANELDAEAADATADADVARQRAAKSALHAKWALRFLNVMQTAGGIAEMMVGCTVSATGVGAVLGGALCVHGADMAVTGSRNTWNDEHQPTMIVNGIAGVARVAGAGEASSYKIAGYVDTAASVGVQTALLRKLLFSLRPGPSASRPLTTTASEASTGASKSAGDATRTGASATATTAGAAAEVASVELTVAQRELANLAEAAVAKGDVHAAISMYDQLAAQGVPAHMIEQMEIAAAQRYGRTPLSVYRASAPMAQLPSGAMTPPSAYGGTLFHGSADIAPEVAFKQGLPARGPSLDLYQHTLQDPTAKQSSAFRGTTIAPGTPDGQGAIAWAGEGGWVYEIDSSPSWNVNQLLEGRVPRPDGSFGGNLMPGETEHAVLAGVPAHRIKGAYFVSTRGPRLVLSEYRVNPSYKAVK